MRVISRGKDVGNFYPRPPRGGRLEEWTKQRIFYSHFYPRPPRGGRQACITMCYWCTKISIHALREEGDIHLICVISLIKYFYPRPPRGGRRPAVYAAVLISAFLSTPSARRATYGAQSPCKTFFQFLSTPSARRATSDCPSIINYLLYFYPRPPRGGRPETSAQRGGCPYISIHALREEGDKGAISLHAEYTTFLSTPSARRATSNCTRSGCPESISIHALREEGDFMPWSTPIPATHFYPRPPRGGRR